MFPTTVRLSGKRMQIAHSQSPETGQSFLIVFCSNWRARSSLVVTVRRWSDPRGEREIKKGDWGSLEAEERNVKSERQGRGAGCQTEVAKSAARHVRPPLWQIPLKMEHSLPPRPPSTCFCLSTLGFLSSSAACHRNKLDVSIYKSNQCFLSYTGRFIYSITIYLKTWTLNSLSTSRWRSPLNVDHPQSESSLYKRGKDDISHEILSPKTQRTQCLSTAG